MEQVGDVRTSSSQSPSHHIAGLVGTYRCLLMSAAAAHNSLEDSWLPQSVNVPSVVRHV